MKQILRAEVLGMTDEKSSEIRLEIDDMFIGNKRVLNVQYSIDLAPRVDIHNSVILERFVLKLSLDNKVLDKQYLEVNLADGVSKTFEKDIDMNNVQFENRMFKLELDEIQNGRLDYTSINEMISISPVKSSKKFIKLEYSKQGNEHKFSYKKDDPDGRVYMKLNNHNWREVFGDFSFVNDKLEGKINYVQLYTTDDENNKIYSNTVRFIKD